MLTLFRQSLDRVLVYEGGKVDDPHDPGGRTNQGVTQRVYDAFRRLNNQVPRDVWQMSPQERDAIYHNQYWEPIKGDELPAGVEFVVFDSAVNSGVSASIKWLQASLGGIYGGAIDGHIGVKTLAAVGRHRDHDRLVADICEHRLAFLKRLKNWKRYGEGWGKRVSNVLATGQAWATGSVPAPKPQYFAFGDMKALEADPITRCARFRSQFA